MKFKIPYAWLLLTPGILWVLGAAFNTIAISANHGMMPVALSTSMKMALDSLGVFADGTSILDDAHKVMQSGDHLKILSDWIQIPHSGVHSIGDELMDLSDYIYQFFFGAWLALVARDHAKA